LIRRPGPTSGAFFIEKRGFPSRENPGVMPSESGILKVILTECDLSFACPGKIFGSQGHAARMSPSRCLMRCRDAKGASPRRIPQAFLTPRYLRTSTPPRSLPLLRCVRCLRTMPPPAFPLKLTQSPSFVIRSPRQTSSLHPRRGPHALGPGYQVPRFPLARDPLLTGSRAMRPHRDLPAPPVVQAQRPVWAARQGRARRYIRQDGPRERSVFGGCVSPPVYQPIAAMSDRCMEALWLLRKKPSTR
jgi:hypothetical protein